MKLTIQLALAVVLPFGAPVFAQLPADEFATRLVDAAMDRLSHNVIYDGPELDDVLLAKVVFLSLRRS